MSSFGSKPAVAPQVSSRPCSQAAQRRHPGVAAGEVDDDVDAAAAAADARLAEAPVHFLHEVAGLRS